MSKTTADAVNPAEFTFAFQPIVDSYTRSVYSYEALVRGVGGESAYSVISRYSAAQMPEFDAACRIKALQVANKVGVTTHLNLNFLPTAALSEKYGLSSTLAAAACIGFPADRLIIEATEGETIGDHARFAEVINEYRRAGVRLAIDDFGAGYSGLNLLAEFQPDIVKLDMSLVRNIHRHGPRQAIVRAIAQVCTDLGIDFIVEGVETVEEYAWFTDQGVTLYQGYLFAKPLFEALPEFSLPKLS